MKSLEYASLLPGKTKCLAGHLRNMKRLWKRRQYSLLAPACHAGGRGFESRPLRQVSSKHGAWRPVLLPVPAYRMTTLNIAIGGWSPPNLDHFAGPADLAHAVCGLVPQDGTFGPSSPISESRLRALLEMAFQASLSPEEGRFPTVRLFVPWQNDCQADLVAAFEAKLPNGSEGVATLKRLSPAAGSLNHLLVVKDIDNEWRCIGLGSSLPKYSPMAIGRNEWHFLFPDRPWGLLIRIDAPGSLRVSVPTGGTLQLRAGTLRLIVASMYVPSLQRVSSEIGLLLGKDSGVRTMTDSKGNLVQIDLPIAHIIDHVISNMQASGCGGTVIFPGPTVKGEIEPKYTSVADAMGAAVCDFYAASRRCSKNEQTHEEFRQSIAAWQRSLTSILRIAEGIAMMSRIDGCVVIDRSFKVTSFGSKLRVPPSANGLPKVHPARNTPENDSDVRRLGMRNQSAYDLCRCVPESTAIIVSQDGDVRIAGSDSKSVSFAESVEASSLHQPDW